MSRLLDLCNITHIKAPMQSSVFVLGLLDPAHALERTGRETTWLTVAGNHHWNKQPIGKKKEREKETENQKVSIQSDLRDEHLW